MNVLFKLFLAVIVLAPLPLGGARLWAWSLLALPIAGMMLVWTVLLWRSARPAAVPISRIWPSAVLFALVIVWAMVQTATWTPESWHHPMWKAASEALGKPLAGSISITPFDGWSVIARLLMYAGVFWLALQLCRDRNRAQLALKVIAIAGTVYAAYGIIVLISDTNTVLWLDRPQYRDVVTATFINKNNYASYAGMILLVITALALQTLEGKRGQGGGLRYRIRMILLLVLRDHWWLTVSWVLLFATILLSNSRAGLVSAVFGIGAFVLTASLRRKDSGTLRKVVLVIGAVAGIFLITNGGQIYNQFERMDQDASFRENIYAATHQAIADAPLTGTGAGSFADAFRIYKTFAHDLSIRRAHNTYLENALELGVPAAIALNLSVAILIVMCVIGVRRRERDSVYPCLAVSAGVLLGLHSLVDFPLQIPANAMTFAFILGLGCAQSWSSRER